MTYIKLSTHIVSTSLAQKKASEKLKELLCDSIIDSEESFNIDFFVEQICSENSGEDEALFVLLEPDEVLTVKDIDIEYSDEDIDIMVNDILYNEEDVEDQDEEDEDEDDSGEFDFSEHEED